MRSTWSQRAWCQPETKERRSTWSQTGRGQPEPKSSRSIRSQTAWGQPKPKTKRSTWSQTTWGQPEAKEQHEVHLEPDSLVSTWSQRAGQPGTKKPGVNLNKNEPGGKKRARGQHGIEKPKVYLLEQRSWGSAWN
jgi:hypothetical protein